MINLFSIIKIKSKICELQLLLLMKIYNIFHNFLLQLLNNDDLSKQQQQTSFFVIIDEQKKYNVKSILSFKLIQSKLHYKIK